MKKIYTFIIALSMIVTASTAFAIIPTPKTIYVDAVAVGAGDGTSQADAYTTIEAAVTAALDGDTIEIYGNFTKTTTTVISTSITLHGNSGATISTSGTNQLFTITGSNVAIKNLSFIKTDKGGVHNLIGIQGNGTEIGNNTFLGQFVIGDGDVSRAMVVSPGVTGYNIHDNSITAFRQPAYIDASTGTVTNNYVTGTKGWVVLSDSNTTFTGNTFGTNVFDIAFIPGASDNYTDIVALSAANGNANIENQFGGTPVLNVVYVDGNVALTGNGTQASPYKTITEAFPRVAIGGKIIVAAGSYTENLTVNKAVTLLGANSTINPVTGTRSAESILTGRMLVTSSNVTIKGFKITNPAYSGATMHGIQVFGNGPTISNINISNNLIASISNSQASPAKGAYGIMIQADVSTVLIENNKIDSISSVGWARGIEITPSCGVVGIPQGVIIRGNSITNITDTDGTDAYNMSIDWCDSVPRIADASQVTLTGNIFDSAKVKNLDTVHPLVITRNFWGTSTPDFSTATGTVTSEPWCLVADCSSIFTRPSETTSGGGGFVAPVQQYYSNGTFNQGTPTGTPTQSSGTINVSGGQVLGVSTYQFIRNLRFGMTGDDVTELQKVLMAGGYLKLKTNIPTKYFGPMTRASLKKWQAANGIPATGYFGPISRAFLNK